MSRLSPQEENLQGKGWRSLPGETGPVGGAAGLRGAEAVGRPAAAPGLAAGRAVPVSGTSRRWSGFTSRPGPGPGPGLGLLPGALRWAKRRGGRSSPAGRDARPWVPRQRRARGTLGCRARAGPSRRGRVRPGVPHPRYLCPVWAGFPLVSLWPYRSLAVIAR